MSADPMLRIVETDLVNALRERDEANDQLRAYREAGDRLAAAVETMQRNQGVTGVWVAVNDALTAWHSLTQEIEG
jgi:hypothetical protein